MGDLIRSKDWSSTCIGDVNNWPVSLRISVGNMLASPFPMYIAWGQDYTQLYNDGYRPILGSTKHPQALGISTKETFKEIWHIIGPMFNGVMEGNAVGFPNFMLPLDRNGYVEECYFDFSYSPIYNEDGSVGGVLVTVVEVTEKYNTLKKLEETQVNLERAQAEAENQRDRLKRFFMQAPAAICVLDGKDMIFELINEGYQQFFPGRELFGKPLLVAIPEIKGEPIAGILKNVYETGETFYGNELLIPLARYNGGPIENRYFNFIYQPRINTINAVDGILVFAFEITEMMTAKRSLEDSEKRFRHMVEQSPVPMLVTRGPDMVFEEINAPMLELIGRDEHIRGKSAYEAMPELKGQPIMDQLLRTFTTGEQWTGFEIPITIRHNDKQVEGYYNISYKPLIENDKITGVLQSAVNVTEQVNARNQLSQAYEQARLSKEAAQLGTFDMDLEKGTLHWDERCRTLFGISHNNEVSYEHDFVGGLHVDDRERVLDLIGNVFIKEISNGDYDVEYRTIGFEDQKLRWVRAKGQAYFNSQNQPIRFIGAVLDITEQKLDELRKNDFIGMVSHELKTPLTTLTAVVQVTKNKLKNTDDPFLKGAMETADLQVRKMANMISGFLNISRLDSGKILINKQEFLIDQLIQEIIEEFCITAATHSIILSQCNPLKIFADRDKIGSVITNLLNNAIKYSPKGRKIEVNCLLTDNQFLVSVKDEGMGIKAKDAERLFDRYYRVESRHTTNISGFGIGLYLSAEIIKRHNGEIWVESEIGVGSTFYFTIPI